jgi:hypothetical protein
MSDIAPETTSKTAAAQESEGSWDWARQNILNPALNAGPLAIYNIAANATSLPECHLTVAEAKPYSANWFVQGLSGGVGAAVPFILAGKGAGKAFRAADGALAGTRAGEILSPALTSSRVANIAGASAFGALQKPDENHTRLGNAIGMGLGFAVFDRGNMIGKQLPLAAKFASYPLTGFVGGAVMSEGSQLFSNGKLAPADVVVQSGVQGMMLNTVIPLAHEGFTRLSTKSVPVAPEQSGRSGSAAERISSTLPGEKPGMVDVRANGIIAPENGLEGSFAKVALKSSADLHALSRTYSKWVNENKPSYPTPEEFAKLTPEEIVQRGFYHPDATNLDLLNIFDRLSTYDAKPRPLPDAKVVASEVAKSVEAMPMARPAGDLILGEWNMEFLTGDKAAYFSDTYKHIVPRHHLMFVEETNAEGLARVAKDNGYNFEISRDNSRGQAVGFLVNPRLKVLGTHSYEEVANVHNIPDLRPAFRVDLQDTATGEKFSAVTVHLKSMRGGPEATAPVRTEQARVLADVLGKKFSGIIAGDWNTFLDKTHELDPLIKAGFKIANPGDATSTQSMGGRLDGFLYRDLPWSMSNPEVRPFFKNPLITRGLSDHGLLTTTLGGKKPGAPAFTFVPYFVGFDPSRN